MLSLNVPCPVLMRSPDSSSPLIGLVGPTGAGKTAVALALAGMMPVSVINADSRQVYRDFPIITAQPTADERAVCPHRLYGFLDTRESFGAGAYARLAGRVIEEERRSGLRAPLGREDEHDQRLWRELSDTQHSGPPGDPHGGRPDDSAPAHCVQSRGQGDIMSPCGVRGGAPAAGGISSTGAGADYSLADVPGERYVDSGGRAPLLVGGTGLYFRALLDGLAEIPAVPEAVSAHWRNRCAEEGPAVLHALLAEQDPPTAARLHPNDRQRIMRALEVRQATGKPLSWWLEQRHSPRRERLLIGIGPDLAELEPRLARRIDAMLEAGAVAEAEAAFKRCPDPAAPGWSGIGCRELHAYLEGRLSLDECRALWLRNTRAYAKRQLTWFRADKGIVWFGPGDADGVIKHLGKR